MWWRPTYQFTIIRDRREETRHFTLDEVSCNECPVTLVTPESMRLVEIFGRAQFVSGAPLYGPDLSRWPARMVDAAAVIQQEQNRTENARSKAGYDA
jgi:hypothetical protein